MAEIYMDWNLLAEIGLNLKIDLYKPWRARKFGNGLSTDDQRIAKFNDQFSLF